MKGALLLDRGQWAIINERRKSKDALIKREYSSFQKNWLPDALQRRGVVSPVPVDELLWRQLRYTELKRAKERNEEKW